MADSGEMVQAALGHWLRIHGGTSLAAASAPNYHYDMLNDLARNAAYERAISAAVLAAGEDALVLDIGSGSGLLAMLAAASSAQHVWTCEADPTLAAATRAVVDANALDRRVSVLGKFSHDLSVSLSGDLPAKVDVIVMEIFDSVLLGEGVLPTMTDAAARLLGPGGIVVPAGASIVGMLVDAPVLAQAVGQTSCGNYGQCFTPFQVHAGPGLASGTIRPLSSTVPLLDFDFARPRLHSARPVIITATASGNAHGVVFWWTLQMAPGVDLSTDPRPDGSLPARDHWRQAACIFSRPRAVQAGDNISLMAGHESEMPWVVLQEPNTLFKAPSACLVAPGMHAAASLHLHPTRACAARLAAMAKVMKTEGFKVLCIGDGPLLSAAFPGAAQLYFSQACASASTHANVLLQPRSGANGLPRFEVEDAKQHCLAFGATAVVAEPFFYDMQASGAKVWLLDEVVRFWQLARGLGVATVAPDGCSIMAQATACPHLFARRQPVNTVHGIDLTVFNTMAARTEGLAVLNMLDWQADLTPSGEPVCLSHLNFRHTAFTEAGTHCAIQLDLTCGPCHAVVLWCDVDYKGTLVSTCRVGEANARQALLVLPTPVARGASLTLHLHMRKPTVAADGPQAVWTALRGGVELSFYVH